MHGTAPVVDTDGFFLGSVVTIQYMLILPTVAAIIYSASDGSLFSVHPICNSLAFVALATEAVSGMRTRYSKTRRSAPKTVVRLHFILMTISIFLALAGFCAIYLNKIKHGRPHFQSWHSWMGIFVILSMPNTVACGRVHEPLSLVPLSPPTPTPSFFLGTGKPCFSCVLRSLSLG